MRQHHGASAVLLLLLCGDIDLHPGPISSLYPCGICELGVNWSHAVVCCDNCDMWYHKSCVSMNSEVYAGIENEQWNCYACGTANCSSFLYHVYNLNVSNSFDPLAGIPGDDSVYLKQVCSPSSTFKPSFSSSPKLLATQTSLSSSSTDHMTSIAGRQSRLAKDNLRVSVLNANSIKNKRATLAAVCDSIDPDIIIITETKLDSSVYSSEFLSSNYSAHRLDRNINGGGIMIAVRNCFTVDDMALDQVTCEFMCVQIAVHKSSPLYVVAYYRPPDEPAVNLDNFEAALGQLQSKINKRGRSTLLVGGDFNVGGVDWDALTTKVNAKNKGTCKRMLDIITDGGLSQLQKEPTRQGEVLDLLCTSNPSLLKLINTIPGISDHDGIVVADFYL